MNQPATLASADQDPQTELTQHQLQELREVMDIGIVLTHHLRNLVFHAAALKPAVDFALGAARLARSIRQTIALQARLAAPPKTPPVKTLRFKTPRIAKPDPIQPTPPAARTKEPVRQTLVAGHVSPARADDPRSFHEIVLDICHTLHLTPEHPRWPTAMLAQTAPEHAASVAKPPPHPPPR